MSQDLKVAVAKQAVESLQWQGVIGVGTGSTVNAWLDELAQQGVQLGTAVASSEATADRLRAMGVRVVDLNGTDVALYVDGADEFNRFGQLIKGGGGALTREKIIAAAARRFVVLADKHKSVSRLGVGHPLPIEVIPMARGYVARECIKMGGQPIYREGVVTDNGNVILDVHRLPMNEPMKTDAALNQIVGVVCHGLFTRPTPDLILCAHSVDHVAQITAESNDASR